MLRGNFTRIRKVAIGIDWQEAHSLGFEQKYSFFKNSVKDLMLDCIPELPAMRTSKMVYMTREAMKSIKPKANRFKPRRALVPYINWLAGWTTRLKERT